MEGSYLLLMLASYVLTVTIETAVLCVGLSMRHSVRVRVFAGVWLSACTYPVVWLVLPPLFEDRWVFLAVAETFAPAAECILFWIALIRERPREPQATVRDLLAITGANLGSFGIGELIHSIGF